MTGVFETQTLRVCPTEQIICVKEDCYAIPKFLTGTFLNANIMCPFAFGSQINKFAQGG